MFYSGGFVIFFFSFFLVGKENIDLAPIIISQSIDILRVQSLQKNLLFFSLEIHQVDWRTFGWFVFLVSFVFFGDFFFFFFWNLPISPRSVSTRFFFYLLSFFLKKIEIEIKTKEGWLFCCHSIYLYQKFNFEYNWHFISFLNTYISGAMLHTIVNI